MVSREKDRRRLQKEVRKLLTITNEKGSHVMSAKEVSKSLGVSLNAVYQSRQKGNKMDKLVAYRRLREILTEFPDIFEERRSKKRGGRNDKND